MDRISFRGVRCFHTEQSASLRPLTLLVGENSTGKTTFLALLRIASDLCRGDPRVDFNEEPFFLGAYDQVASFRGGRAGRVTRFEIGGTVLLHRAPARRRPDFPLDAFTVSACFTRRRQLMVSEWTLRAGPFEVRIEYGRQNERPSLAISGPSGTATVEVGRAWPAMAGVDELYSLLFFATMARFREDGFATLEGDLSRSDLETLNGLALELSHAVGPRPYAFAPIRTRPQRTYEPFEYVRRPEGSHVPVVLARTSLSDPDAWEALRDALDSFGAVSGLFTDVSVRKLGRKPSDPFQIRVKISGPHFNLVDVGYGVSQALPIVVNSLREPEGSTFLLQQPEVHLHPRAQSELASFLALLSKRQDKRFVIETHSDYIVDRIRTDVRTCDYLTPSDVSILYFARDDGGVEVHQLELDEFGNIVNPSEGYRQFFLEEERRVLGG